MHHADYVALHLHTEYSLLDGAIRIDELVETASAMRMPAVAVTDHGNLFAAVEFYRKAVASGIKPIIGCEVYVAAKSRLDRKKDEDFHLVLLAKDAAGYRNLLSLVSRAYTEGFYYRPRIDHGLLEQYSGGLIGLTACLKGEVPCYLRRGETEKAREAALFYKNTLGPENFYIEVQDNGLEEQTRINRRLVELASELHIGLVATNDCHYLRAGDAKAHDILLCIQTGKTVSDPDRLRFGSEGFYFKSPEEMKAAFSEIPEALLNTRAIAERCSVELPLGGTLLPRFSTPDGSRPSEFLERLAREGLMGRFGNPEERYRRRLEEELGVIRKMGFSSYFLIVWDFINHAKEKGIPVGPGRGSAAGSLVAYSLGITEIDPIRYGLLFERFLNPERISMPDIDVDFCKDRRAEVLSHVTEKYGVGHVAQIITFGTMAARAAIRDVARALNIPYGEADRLAKLVPEGPKVTLDAALSMEPSLKEAYDTDPKVRELLDIARRLEGLARHASTHAAGVVISPEPLTDYAPLYRNPQDGTIVTQFDMGAVEKLGLVKFDLLGLKTLTVIEKTLRYIKESGAEVSLPEIPLDDKKTYDLLCAGQTTGIFQLESHGMRDLVVRLEPRKFEDLIALVALFRPGPMNMMEDFIKRKRREVSVKYDIPALKDILDETHGVMLYQEQVMSIANRLAGFSMGQADILRKAMGKKQPEEMEKLKEGFIKGAVSKGTPKEKARGIFEKMEKFAEYGFNKSHSAAYAFVAYQTAYLKAHYPVEFMAATLSADIDNTDKIVKSINECRSMSIEILPPDINQCGREFRVMGRAIRFGLGAVKGVGGAAIESIVGARESGPFESFEEFLSRVDSRKVNRKVMECLIKAGAFDSLGPPPKVGASFRGLEEFSRWRAHLVRRLESSNGQTPSLSLFGVSEGGKAAEEEGWGSAELLRFEKEALGFYITANPMSKYRGALAGLDIKTISELEGLEDKKEVSTAGVITAVKKLRTKEKGETMAYLSLEDDDGTLEALVFPELFRTSQELIRKDLPVMLKGSLDRTEKGLKLIVKEIADLDESLKEGSNGRKVELTINGRGVDLGALRAIVSEMEGPLPLFLKLKVSGMETLIRSSHGVSPDALARLEEVLGKDAVRVI